jgi:hypothetical protein
VAARRSTRTLDVWKEKLVILVIIYWKIKLGDENRAAFLKHWKETLTISERSHLIGEFLSRPLAPDETDFPCGLLGLPSSSAYQSFFNVGIWSDLDSFKRQVIDPHVGKAPKPLEFEFVFRERLVLEPVSRRIGQGKLPQGDEFVQ